MRKRKDWSLFVVLLLILVPPVVGQNHLQDECARTANLQTYSSAFVDRETGDLNGYELAIDEHKDSTVNAFLYVYEGGESEGIPLPGHLSSDKLLISGTWVEHLIENPSKKEVVQTHSVKISGVLKPSSFQGKLNIEGMETDQYIRLKRVKHVWGCNRQ